MAKKKPKYIPFLTHCPNCKKTINEVEGGYFCRWCLKEYDKDGVFMAPISSTK